jgi:hypothetical protein
VSYTYFTERKGFLMMKVGDRVERERFSGYPDAHIEYGSITEVDSKCYQPTHEASDPWVSIQWESGSRGYAVWSTHLSDGTKLEAKIQ